MKNRRKFIIVIGSIFVFIAIVVFLINSDRNETKKSFCIIKFESLGGSSIMSQKIKCGETLSNLPTPEKEGFEFVEWIYNDKTFDIKTEINDDISLMARWKVLENYDVVKITFDTNGGAKIADIEIIKGNILNKPNNPSRNGYVFKGWYLNDEKFNFENKINEDINLIAKWEKNKPISEEELKEQINNNDNLTEEEKNDSNNNLYNGNSKKEYYYLYQYDAFETISCKYENFYYKEDTGLCYDNKYISATNTKKCSVGTYGSDGMCHVKENYLVEAAIPVYVCPDGYLLENDNMCRGIYTIWGLPNVICPEGLSPSSTYSNGSYSYYTCSGLVGTYPNIEYISGIEAEYSCEDASSYSPMGKPKLIKTDNSVYCECYKSRNPVQPKINSYYCEDSNLTLSGSSCVTTSEVLKNPIFTCPYGYKLNGKECVPVEEIRNAPYSIKYDCLEGDYGEYTRVMINNKCYDRYEK